MSRSDNHQQLGSRFIRLSPLLILAAALVALAVFFVNYAPPASADHTSDEEVWSATLTVRVHSQLKGCHNTISQNGCHIATNLSGRNFTYAGAEYTIHEIYLNNQNQLQFVFTGAIPASLKSALALSIDGRQFRLANANSVNVQGPNDGVNWPNPGLSWSAGQTVQLKLVRRYWTGVDLYGGGLVQHSDGALTLDVTKTSGNTFRVRLTQAPTATVTVTFSKLATAFGIDDFDAFDAVPASVTFGTGNWQTGQQVTVSATTDAAVGDSIIISAAVSIAGTANANDPYRNPDRRNGFVVTVKAGGL